LLSKLRMNWSQSKVTMIMWKSICKTRGKNELIKQIRIYSLTIQKEILLKWSTCTHNIFICLLFYQLYFQKNFGIINKEASFYPYLKTIGCVIKKWPNDHLFYWEIPLMLMKEKMYEKKNFNNFPIIKWEWEYHK
jgi:hypothetical protein